MTADILKFTVQPARIVDKAEIRVSNALDLYFQTWRFWLRVWGVI